MKTNQHTHTPPTTSDIVVQRIQKQPPCSHHLKVTSKHMVQLTDHFDMAIGAGISWLGRIHHGRVEETGQSPIGRFYIPLAYQLVAPSHDLVQSRAKRRSSRARARRRGARRLIAGLVSILQTMSQFHSMSCSVQ